MLYRKNMGTKERVARLLGGALIAGCALMQVGFTPLGLVLAGSGVSRKAISTSSCFGGKRSSTLIHSCALMRRPSWLRPYRA